MLSLFSSLYKANNGLKHVGGNEEPDIYAVGFQEIVELSPQQVRVFFILLF